MGERRTLMPVLANTASKASVNLLSRSRTNRRNECPCSSRLLMKFRAT